MKIAFIAHRANYLKHYGPIIDEALARGWQPECWVQDADQGGKEHLRLSPQVVLDTWPEGLEVQTFQSTEEIEGLAKRRRVDALVSLHPRSTYSKKRIAAKFITLQHSVDTFVDAHDDLATSDAVCLFTPFWWDYALRYYAESEGIAQAELEETLLPKVIFTGFPQMDVFGKIQPEGVRARLGLPAGRKVVLVMPIDLAGWDGLWPPFFAASGLRQWRLLVRARKSPGFLLEYWKWPLLGWNDKNLAASIKKFCQNNDALLLLKGREKDPLRPAWVSQADKKLSDVSHYPATGLEAIAVADLCIVFYSTAVQEAAYAGVPSLCIDRPNRQMLKHKLWRVKTEGGPYNFPGVVSWRTLPSMMTRFPKENIEDFCVEQTARQKYLDIYNGPADHRASKRVLDILT